MQPEQLLEIVNLALEDLKAQDIKVLDVREMSSVTDIMVIASGTSTRQVSSIARNVEEEAKKNGVRAIGSEGLDIGEWALVDLGDVVVHVMLPTVRDFYQLEKLWSDIGSDIDQEETKD
ncbi:ribosome silencing factor [Candidatus Albibeggiatoa sp. nov. BB20]|uniref:ribosome silencing factor n=1 Tax=Candidatus Albibeggiatoa sp. nov. BB20 TaxID=3162723 RepID=UPI00336567D3